MADKDRTDPPTESIPRRLERAIDVLHIAFPDGTSLWSDRVSSEYASQCVASWKAGMPADKLARYEAAGALCGAVVLRMLRSEYERIPATNQIEWPNE